MSLPWLTRFRDYGVPMQALETITLVVAQARYELTVDELHLVERLLEGKEQRSHDGPTYLVIDVEAAVTEARWR